MEKIIKKLGELFYNSGFDEPIYQNYQEEIILQNSRMVQTTSFIGAIMMLFLTIAAFFVSSIMKVLPLYCVTAIVFTIIYLVARFKNKTQNITLICNYAFLSVAFFFAICLDIIQSNATATTVCVLLVALPLLIVDRPYREIIYFSAVSVCFMLESVYIKQSPKASIDVLNAISFLIVGNFLGYKHNQMVLRNIRGQNYLKIERDTDTLTALYNKGAIEERATFFLKGKNVKASMIVIDMDNFKYVNDTYGHHAGDEILIGIGSVLSSLFRKEDLVSRFGGDEFVVFLPNIDTREALQMRAEQILESVSQIRITADDTYRAHICMGIATYPADGSDYETLFKSADDAMYIVKKHGKNGYGFYTANVRKKILVVDDYEINRAVLKKTLEQEYDILEAKDGAEALEVLKRESNIVMVITDIQMPNMDGISLIKRIRSDDRFAGIAIIANTQYGDMKQEEYIFSLGVDDFVYKAASPYVIQMRVKNVLHLVN